MTPAPLRTALLLLSILNLLNHQATAADPGPIESIMPAPASLGPGWTRDTDLLMENVESPPTPRGDSPEEQLARQVLGQAARLLAAALGQHGVVHGPSAGLPIGLRVPRQDDLDHVVYSALMRTYS